MKLTISAVLAAIALIWSICAFSAPALSDETNRVVTLQDMRKVMERSYRKSKVSRKQNKTITEVRSRTIRMRDFVTMGADGRTNIYIETKKDNASDTAVSTILLRTRLSEGADRASAASPGPYSDPASPGRYQWVGYRVSFQAKNERIELDAADLSDRVEKPLLGQVEKLEISMDTMELVRPIKSGSGLDLVLQSRSGTTFQIQIPFSFLIGYFAKMSEAGVLPEKEAALVNQLRAAILERAGN